jgi:hypothetical protein
MRKTRITVVSVIFGLAVLSGTFLQGGDSSKLKGPYLRQEPPGLTPKIFAPGIVSTDRNELNCTFSPDQKQMFFTRTINGRHTIMVMTLAGNIWKDPETASFSGDHVDVDPYVSSDGNRLYFSSRRPLQGNGTKDSDLWYVEKEKDGPWGQPVRIKNINTPGRHDYYTSIAGNGTIYFSIFSEDGRTGDLFRWKKGGNKKEKLPKPINTQYNEHDPCIAPDGSYLIFSSSRPGGFGSNDLYITFRLPDSSWSEPENMGDTINTSGYDYCPMVTHDHRFLFFTRSLNRNGDIYWVDAEIINKFRKNTGK